MYRHLDSIGVIPWNVSSLEGIIVRNKCLWKNQSICLWYSLFTLKDIQVILQEWCGLFSERKNNIAPQLLRAQKCRIWSWCKYFCELFWPSRSQEEPHLSPSTLPHFRLLPNFLKKEETKKQRNVSPGLCPKNNLSGFLCSVLSCSQRASAPFLASWSLNSMSPKKPLICYFLPFP